ncbi:cytochrome P450 [Xylogone sp. PMI_703]|nr:cytochrome P450 [Xylogone sp. PMI_703]
MDDFWEPALNSSSSVPAAGLVSRALNIIYKTPASVIFTTIFGFISLIILTRLISGNTSKEIDGQHNRSVWMPPYWIPIIGHAIPLDQSLHGIFALKLGGTTHTIMMQQKECAVQFRPVALSIVKKFFGLKAINKWESSREEWGAVMGYLMKEPHLGNFMRVTVRRIEDIVPSMFSFMEGEVDQHSWERWAHCSYINDNEEEVDLNAVLRDVLGQASVPAIFGRAYLENNPDILHDVYDLDNGMMYFLMGLPWWTPWPNVVNAHMARWRIRESLAEFSQALEDTLEGRPVDTKWDNMDDVSEFIHKRHEIFRSKWFNQSCSDHILLYQHGFTHKERGDMPMLCAMVVNATALVYWQILYILATPGLLDRVRKEVAPYVKVIKPAVIGTISESPGLQIDQESLTKYCPLFKATYLESLRLSSQPWSVRKVAKDVSIALDKQDEESVSYLLKSGGYITLPHDLHMRDKAYFQDPEKFIPERFLHTNEDGTVSTDIGTIRPYGGGPSMCKGRQIAERECLAFVAAVLTYWDIEPADSKKLWVIPAQKKTSAVSLPVQDTRVRVKRRVFSWVE